MKKVEVKVTSDQTGDQSPVSMLVEESRASGGWNRLDGRDGVTGGNAESFVLRPGQRLVIEPFVTPAMVYDREQGAAINPLTQKNDEGKADAPKPGTPSVDQPKPNPAPRPASDPNPGLISSKDQKPRDATPAPVDSKQK